MTSSIDLDIQEAMWLADPKNSHFRMRPATIREFCGQGYLEIANSVRAGVMEALVDVFGEELDPIFISKVREALVSGGIGIGKLLLEDEQVLSPTGWVRNGDLQVGDLVVGKNGKPTRVLGVFDHKDIQIYRVRFKDGTWLDVGDMHLWEVWRRSTGGKYIREVLDTEELYNSDLRQGTSWKYHIPLVDPVEFEQSGDLPCDPYTVGSFLANGSMHSGTPRLGCHVDDREELLDYIDWQRCAHSWDATTTGRGGSVVFRALSSDRSKWSNPLAAKLNDAGIYGLRSRDKFIPERYMFANVQDRIDLLHGLMDGDGHVTKSNATTYSTSSHRLAEDVAGLVRSLGGYCTITSFARKGTAEYQVHVNTGDLNPFKLARKAQAWKPRTNQGPRRSIVGAEKLGRSDGRCIKVGADDELYVTKDFIVTHNTTLASIALPYMVHWVQCLKDPQDFYDLMSGTKIAFMMMSTSARQARDVLFDDVKARIDNSPWFAKYSPRDDKFDTRIVFPRQVYIIPGGSEETQFEGYNILGGVLDEGDSHKKTMRKDYAQEGWNTISSRIDSRFNNAQHGCHMGLIMVIGQKKSAEGFMAKKQEELQGNPSASVTIMTIWDSKGWYNYTDNPADAVLRVETGERKSFYFDTMRKEVLPKESVLPEDREAKHMIEVPMAYFSNFLNDPVKALKDLAGLPPAAVDPFIPQTDRIITGQTLWEERYGTVAPVVGALDAPQFADELIAGDQLKRVIHIDLAFSGDGDALGIAMGHIPELVEIAGEEKPMIAFDFLLRMKAKPGKEIMLSDVRKLIYELKFKRGFNIKVVSMDGFNTTDTMQQFRKKKLNAQYLSVDKTKMPYIDLRESIYEERCIFPNLAVKYNHMDVDSVNIAFKELSQLSEGVRKVDHPSGGSKDVADCMAGVVHTLMNEPGMRRGIKKRTSTSLSGDDTADVEEMLKKLSVPSHNQMVQESFEGGRTPTFDEFKQFGLDDRSSGLPVHVERNDSGAGPTRLW